MFRSKKITIAVATLATALMLLTGTYAWQQMITKTNEFIGTKDDVVLHDDFDPNTGAKDVYVENPSETSLFIRVKLNEAMKLGDNKWRPAKNDWVSHIFETSAADCGHSNSNNKKFHDSFTWTMGGSKFYMPADGSQAVVQDNTVYNANSPGVHATPNGQIVKAETYLNMSEAEQKAFVGWIYDTDGYAYWSRPVAKGEVTGLLLHKVDTDAGLKGTEYYYAIDVAVEAVDKLDIPMWTRGEASVDKSGTKYPEATAQGKQIIAVIEGIS